MRAKEIAVAIADRTLACRVGGLVRSEVMSYSSVRLQLQNGEFGRSKLSHASAHLATKHPGGNYPAASV